MSAADAGEWTPTLRRALYEEGREKVGADLKALRHGCDRGSRLPVAESGFTPAAGLAALVAGYEDTIVRPDFGEPS